MKKYTILSMLLAFAVFAAAARADDMATIRAFLDNKTDDAAVLHGVNMACLSLTRTGTADAAPVLAELLPDERFNTVACTALTNLPGDAGVKALREALKTLEGNSKIAVIQTLGAIRDAESAPALMQLADSTEDAALAEATIRALGNIATFQVIKYIKNFKTKAPAGTCHEAALNAADRLHRDGKTKEAGYAYNVAGVHGQSASRDAARLNFILLLPEEKSLPLLASILKSSSDVVFKIALRAVLEMKSDKTGAVVLESMGGLSAEKQALLIGNLGARKDAVIVPELMKIALGDEPVLQIAAIHALGEIGDLRAVDTILPAVSSPDADLSAAAQAALKRFQGDAFNAKVVTLLDGSDKTLRLAALDMIGERQIASAGDKIKPRFADADADIRAAAYKAFARCVTPTADDIRVMLTQLAATENTDEQTETRAALKTLCRKTADRDNAARLFAETLKTADTPAGEFILDLLFQLGGESAAAAITSAAMGGNDALTDKATQLLGRWTTPEVAPYLLEIAEKHPVERYRVRTLSGYLRVVRQMGLPAEQKVEMAEKALAVATRDADRQRATEVAERFRKMMKGTPIFDGKTFEGWEFRDNQQWFRVQDGAIVCGTLENDIPRNEFVTSAKEYGDFTFRAECKTGGSGANGGIQFRSVRAPADGGSPSEMIGYQADMTDTVAYWGAIYDESRRNRFVAEPPRELMESLYRPNDWNEYEIVCKENNVKLYLNGTLTVDYTETDADIPLRGFIGLQVHGGPPAEIWYRNIRIEEN